MRKTIQNLCFLPKDILSFENSLCRELRSFLSFAGHAIYFPKHTDPSETTFLPEEKILLIPVLWRNERLAMLRLTGVSVARTRKLMGILATLLSSLLEKCLLERMLHEDFETGLVTEDEFFEAMQNEASEMEHNFSEAQISVSNTPLYRLCKGLVVLSWRDGRRVAQEFSQSFYENVFRKLAEKLKSLLPESAIATSLGKYEGRHEFAILFNASGRNACHTLARKLCAALEALEFKEPLGEKPYRAVFFGGHALYPQDMNGKELHLSFREQTMRLRDRARLGVRAALQNKHAANEKIMGFAAILKSGGIVSANLGKGNYRINLGLGVNARVGMRFLLLGKNGNVWRPKGQMVILETGPIDSIATIVTMERTGELPEVCDRLIAISHSSAWKDNLRENSPARNGPNSFLCEHAEFVGRFQQAANLAKNYVLGLARAGQKADIPELIDSIIRKIEWAPDLMAPYGLNGFAFFLAENALPQVEQFIENVLKVAESKGIVLEIGLFKWPFLNFSKSESEDCVLKAIEYASLLPPPRVGWFNSMAITIGADRKFGLGDNYGALEDYRLALLADSHNATARNSMGVCLAALGRFEDARKTFENAMEETEDSSLLAKIHYNLGVVHQKIGDQKLASQNYRKCLKKDKTHVFAWLRLGQIAEERGSRGRARQLYFHAASLTGSDSAFFNTVQRRLANLEAKGNRQEQARGRLHDNLVRNPDDVASLAMLAKLYLEKNLDLSLAEMLARKCVSLFPSSENWRLLARALEAQGKTEDATIARKRGGD